MVMVWWESLHILDLYRLASIYMYHLQKNHNKCLEKLQVEIDKTNLL